MKNLFTRRRLLRIAAALGILFVAAQFIRPELKNPGVVADLEAPPEIEGILRRACYDCHSNETKLRWFDQVVPGYWLVAKDVRDGRAHLNFSEMGQWPAPKQKAMLYESLNQITRGAMPPSQYTLLHRSAAVSADEVAILKRYLQASPPVIPPASAPLPAPPVAHVAAAPNGLNLPPDYTNWRVLTTTDRFDNGTMRVVAGNDIAFRAIDESHITPWPDGAAFAKIAWNDSVDPNGVIRPGTFRQVEIMVKDANAYASTAGWGWGRWLGNDLTPYGKTDAFTAECVSCHKPMKENDFVFTLPIHAATPKPEADNDLFNRLAALPADLPHDPFKWRVITSSMDRGTATMSAIMGNDTAVDHARTHASAEYPVGALLARVTWGQQEDVHWFGARLPAQVRTVEFVDVGAHSYDVYEGAPLRKGSTPEGQREARIASILGEQAPPLPVAAR